MTSLFGLTERMMTRLKLGAIADDKPVRVTHDHPRTPDGRYFVVRGRLWRTSNPNLGKAERDRLVRELMSARPSVRNAAGGPVETAAARAAVEAAKIALGERGPVWWGDSAPDYNRRMAKATPYAAWFAGLAS